MLRNFVEIDLKTKTETDTISCLDILQHLDCDPGNCDWSYMISIVDSTPMKLLLGYSATRQFVEHLHVVYGGVRLATESDLNVLPVIEYDSERRLVVKIFVGGVDIDMTHQEFCNAVYAIWRHSISSAYLNSDLLSGVVGSEYLNYMNDGSCPVEYTAKMFESNEIKFEVTKIDSDDVHSLIESFQTEDSWPMIERINMNH